MDSTPPPEEAVSQVLSAESTDEGPAAVRRRTDLDGCFESTKRNPRRKSGRRQKAQNHRTSLYLESNEAEGKRSLQDVTLTPQKQYDEDLQKKNDTSLLNQNSGGTRICIDVASGQSTSEHVIPEKAGSYCKEITRENKSDKHCDSTRTGVGCSFEVTTAGRSGESSQAESSGSSVKSSDFDGDNDETENTGSQSSSQDIVEMLDCAVDKIRDERRKGEFARKVISKCFDDVSMAITSLQRISTLVFGSCDEWVDEIIDEHLPVEALEQEFFEGPPRKTPGLSFDSRLKDMATVVQHACYLAVKSECEKVLRQEMETQMEMERICISSTTYKENPAVHAEFPETRIEAPESSTSEDEVIGRHLSCNKNEDCDNEDDEDDEDYDVDNVDDEEAEEAEEEEDKYHTSDDEPVKRSMINETYKSVQRYRKKVNHQFKKLKNLISVVNRRQERTSLSYQILLNCAKCMVAVMNQAMKANREALKAVNNLVGTAGETSFMKYTFTHMSQLIEVALYGAEKVVGLMVVVKNYLKKTDDSVFTLKGSARIGASIDRDAALVKADVQKLALGPNTQVGERHLRARLLDVKNLSGALSEAYCEVQKCADSVRNVSEKSEAASCQAVKAVFPITVRVVEVIGSSVRIIRDFKQISDSKNS